ncbi:MAG: DUF4331 domain-containing protein [Deltaproteobacteria bacterium]|nr:DUF4331 domain-containing protein [Deltaproteobacteria bacterium]
MKILSRTLLSATVAAAAFAALPQTASASSHREAPSIAEDQYADNTDVYSFISPSNPDNLVMVANFVPLLIPSSGPNFYRFSDNVRYEILIDTDGDAHADTLYHWVFHTTTDNGQTFLYNTGPITSLADGTLNVRQSYDLYKATIQPNGQKIVEKVVENAPVAPWNVGSRSFPDDGYEGVAQQAITSTTDGGQVFAGPRDEPFFVDLHVFDLLGVGGAPTTDGVNVMSLVLEVPITELTGAPRPEAGSAGPDSVVGIYARAKRPIVTVRTPYGFDANFGGFQQVSRLGWPLINEVVIPLQDKDVFNRSHPANDVANFGAYILDPELPGLLNAVLGAGCAPTPADGRLDIVGLLSPNGTTAADLLRINITADQTFANSGFPNGRTLEDDVTDTLLTVVCNNGGALGDGVDDNDLAFFDSMPYLASPHSGNPAL